MSTVDELSSPHPSTRRKSGLPEGTIGSIETEQFCDCGYNLHGQYVTKDERLEFPVVRCPECGKWHPAGAGSSANRQWLARLGVLLLLLWLLIFLGIMVAGTLVQMAFNMIAYEEVFWPAGSSYRYRSYETPLFWKGMFLLMPFTLGLLLGLLQTCAMWHVRRFIVLAPMAIVLVLAALLAGIGLADHYFYSDQNLTRYAWLIIVTCSAANAAGWMLMLFIGRPVARAVVSAVVPPRPRQFLAFLWTADGKEPPFAATRVGNLLRVRSLEALQQRVADKVLDSSSPPPRMTGPYRWINLAEAAFWILLGLVVALVTLTRRPGEGRCLWLPLVLIAFGVSDVVETQTGAWWRPWWLLLWKGLCVALLFGFALRHIYLTRRQRRHS